MSQLKLTSEITCPICGERTEEAMPAGSCLFFWECPGCEEVIKPKQGNCCVFCSYGSHPCPPMQKEKSCC